MTLKWAEMAGTVALIAGGSVICYAVFRRSLHRALAEQQQETERQFAALGATIERLEDKVAELSRIPELPASTAPEFTMAEVSEEADAPAAAAVEQSDKGEDEEVPREMMPVLAAAATAFLGREVRILSAKKLQSPRQGLSPWSQQGRVFVQASHNLRARG
jgi:hypothetical protein